MPYDMTNPLELTVDNAYKGHLNRNDAYTRHIEKYSEGNYRNLGTQGSDNGD